MKGLWVTLAIVFAALVVAGLFIFSGNNKDTQPGENNPGASNNSAVLTNQSQNNSQTQNENQQQTYNIEIKGYAFATPTLNIKNGDTVIWTNKDSTQHTVTSDGTELSSSLLSGEQTYSHTFTQAGTFNYHCAPHPYMKGKVVVE